MAHVGLVDVGAVDIVNVHVAEVMEVLTDLRAAIVLEVLEIGITITNILSLDAVTIATMKTGAPAAEGVALSIYMLTTTERGCGVASVVTAVNRVAVGDADLGSTKLNVQLRHVDDKFEHACFQACTQNTQYRINTHTQTYANTHTDIQPQHGAAAARDNSPPLPVPVPALPSLCSTTPLPSLCSVPAK